ncbi:MAG: 4-hydroxy-tetrahydrodipicolinate synthase [Actinobacteria bacterium]|nr:4-hydroxy-tetrahydrodipicolinate synthase [Actinomycetota bacterium]
MQVTSTTAPFGTMLTAMVTPFNADGSMDLDGAAALATYLVDRMRNTGLVVSGTTGESPTTADEEKVELLRVVVDAIGDRAHVVAGVGNNDTLHTVEIARQATQAGADALMVVTPYYNRPPQEGVAQHFLTIADATDLPIVTYDIPKRTGTAIETETLVRIAEHPRIVANKDAKGDLEAAQWVIRRTGLPWYSGDDAMNLPLLSVGAVGAISVAGHFVGDRIEAVREAFLDGRVADAIRLNSDLLPVYSGIFRTAGVILTKAGLNEQGLPAGPVRLPLVNATPEQIAVLRRDLAESGVPGFA